jgi:signal transduction histidine kinase/HPt (histidine-containing phosphotransfer) domain-containing protein
MNTGPIPVLLIEDNPGDSRLVREALAEGGAVRFEVEWCKRLDHALKRLSEKEFEVILLDLSLPDCSASETVSRVQAHARNVPIVVMTGLDDEKISLESVKDGAQDYLVKGQFDGRLLTRAIRYAIERMRAQDEMARARDSALEVAGLKSAFLANVSHEVRTPMNAIIGMTRMLLDTPLNDEQKEFAQAVWSSGHSLLGVINDILDFSKVSSGELKIRDVEFNPTETVESALEMFAERALESGVELISYVDGDVPTRLRGDPDRVRQVLANLIGNAVKFSGNGEVAVLVRKESETERVMDLHFTVRDNGAGIAPEIQRTLFQPFVQGDLSMTRRHGGAGLGLAISAQMVELMRGRIGLESKVGEGSLFWFTVRLRKCDAVNHHRDPARERLWGLRALVVGSARGGSDLTRRQLAAWGIDADAAHSGAEALTAIDAARLARKPYRVAICDSVLSDMPGLDLARKAAAGLSGAKTRFVVVYPMGQRPADAVLRKAGIKGSLAKPLRQTQLASLLADAVAPADARAAAAHRIAISGTVPPPREPPDPAAREAHAGKRILLVEDHAVNRKVAMKMLERLGYQADAVANGIEALDALERARYDLILMDCQMPEMDGYQATSEIRRRYPPPQHIPIVAVTAHALEGDRQKCLDAGIDDYLSKPFLPEQLAEKIESGLAKHPITAPLRRVAPNHAPAPTSAITPSAIERLRSAATDDAPNFLIELIDTFLADMAGRLTAMRREFANGNAISISRLAHGLRGSCAHFGAVALMTLCARIEQQAGAGPIEPVGNTLAQLEAEALRVRTELEAQRAVEAAG